MPYINTEWSRRTGLSIIEIMYYLHDVYPTYPKVCEAWKKDPEGFLKKLETAIGSRTREDKLTHDLAAVRKHVERRSEPSRNTTVHHTET